MVEQNIGMAKMNDQPKIEKGIPMPSGNRPLKTMRLERALKRMRPGTSSKKDQSYLFDGSTWTVYDSARRIGVRIKLRSEYNGADKLIGYRIWRVK